MLADLVPQPPGSHEGPPIARTVFVVYMALSVYLSTDIWPPWNLQIDRHELMTEDELHRGTGYRLHSANKAGRMVAVKVFEGRQAKEVIVGFAPCSSGIANC